MIYKQTEIKYKFTTLIYKFIKMTIDTLSLENGINAFLSDHSKITNFFKKIKKKIY